VSGGQASKKRAPRLRWIGAEVTVAVIAGRAHARVDPAIEENRR